MPCFAVSQLGWSASTSGCHTQGLFARLSSFQACCVLPPQALADCFREVCMTDMGGPNGVVDMLRLVLYLFVSLCAGVCCLHVWRHVRGLFQAGMCVSELSCLSLCSTAQ